VSIDEKEKIKIVVESTPEIVYDKIIELMRTKWTSSEKERFIRYMYLAVNGNTWN